MRLSRLLPLFCIALAACSDGPAASAGDVRVRVTQVRTDPTISGPDVLFEVRNEGGTPAYLDTCGGGWVVSAVDRWDGNSWEEVFPEGCMLPVYSPPLELGPGEVVDGEQVVHKPGLYRLRVGVSERGDERPDWNTVVTEFAIPD